MKTIHLPRQAATSERVTAMQTEAHAWRRASSRAALVFALGVPVMAVQAAPIAFANAVLADAPSAYWRLNELPGTATAPDSSGNSNNGAYSATGIALGVAGLGGGDSAARFDGLGSGRIVVPNSATLNPANITVEALLSWSGPNGFQQRVLEKSRFSGGELPQYGLNILPDGKVKFEIQVGATNSFMDSIGAVQLGVATDVAATYDGSLMRIYLDGVLDSVQAPSLAGGLPFNLTDLGIGNQVDRDRPFNGLIDELALYDKALSADRIQGHLAAVPEPSAFASMLAGLVASAAFVSRRRRRDRSL